MGIAASQARYLMLTARKSNIEFQGQQINQQRTTLANQTSSYNSQLLGLTVPTAPSTSQFTSTSYTMKLNGNTCAISPKGIVYDEAAGTYTVPYTFNTTETEAQSAGTKTFTGSYAAGFTASNNNSLTLLNNGNVEDSATLNKLHQDLNVPQYTIGGVELKQVDKSKSENQTNIQNAVGSYDANTTYYSYISSGVTYYTTANELANAKGVTAGELGTNETPAVKVYHYDATKAEGQKAVETQADVRETQFYSFTANNRTTYVNAEDALASATAAAASEDANVNTYYINDSASVTKTGEITKASITWSDSGRISTITDKNGNEYNLSATTTTDDDAYKDAMNEYTYAKQIYEQQINNINAKLDIVQQQDKTLELQLTQLDTEQKAVSTEEEAVKKVLEKNAEAFKTFA